MKKVNVAELLKDCPTGMELDCTMFENVTFVRVDMNKRQFPIEIAVSGIRSKYLTKEGCFHDITLLPESKCVIFPKGKTTWEGFVPPCQFKDGDVLHIVTGEGDYSLCIVDCIIGNVLYTKASCSYNGHFLCTCEEQVNMNELVVARLALEEEKQKLFKAIKDNGYKWNAETKTLEKSKKERFDLSTLVPFESRVLVRTKHFHDKWIAGFFSHKDSYEFAPFWTTADKNYQQCIPYENNEYLLGTTDDCDEYYKTWKD